MNRFQQALLLQSACNARAVAHRLVDFMDEARKEGGDEREDPAVKLVLHQLVWLVLKTDVEWDYSAAYAACEEKKDENLDQARRA